MKKLKIKKVTLQDLDTPVMQEIAGGIFTQVGQDTCQALKYCLTQPPANTCSPGC
jgi:hypothetical protein